MSEQIMVIPDVHECIFWREVLDFDGQIVFLGDYTDLHGDVSKVPTTSELYDIFDIVAFKRENPERVTLLVGNHELHYYDPRYRASGFNNANYEVMHGILTAPKTRNLFKLCKQIDSTLFTHAGVLKGWYDRHYKAFEGLGDTLEDRLNAYFAVNKGAFYEVGKERGGSADFGSPLWADMDEHYAEKESFDPEIQQVVGHTPFYGSVGNITFTDWGRPHIELLRNEKSTTNKYYTMQNSEKQTIDPLLQWVQEYQINVTPKITEHYDANGKLVTVFEFDLTDHKDAWYDRPEPMINLFDKKDAIWENWYYQDDYPTYRSGSRFERTYNGCTVITKEFSLPWYELQSEQEFLFDNRGNMVKQIEKYYDDDSGWLVMIYEYTYDDSNNRIRSIMRDGDINKFPLSQEKSTR